jgi:cytoskeletal protein CcmA (bactofilin family)
MALQKINWLQIDTATVPSGSVVDLGAVSGALHAVYADNLFISGQTLQQYIENSGTAELNLYSASLKAAIETTGSNLTVKGNLLVKGTTTAVNSTTVSIGDNVIELNGSEAAYGGLMVKDVTSPNTISGSLLWDSTNDRWIGGPLGNESRIVLQPDLQQYSSSVATLINNVGIFRQTGSFYATTHDLQVTGSMRIKGDLIVDGTTTLRQPNDPNLDTLIVSGAMNIVKNEIGAQLVRAQLKIENLGALSDRAQISVLDCGDGFF